MAAAMMAVATPARDPVLAAQQAEPAQHGWPAARPADARVLKGYPGSTPWPVPAGQTMLVGRWAKRLPDPHCRSRVLREPLTDPGQVRRLLTR